MFIAWLRYLDDIICVGLLNERKPWGFDGIILTISFVGCVDDIICGCKLDILKCMNGLYIVLMIIDMICMEYKDEYDIHEHRCARKIEIS